MNSDLLTKLVAALTPDSALRKLLETPPLMPVIAGPKGQHVRAGYTKSNGKPRDKARAKLARESRRRNRAK